MMRAGFVGTGWFGRTHAENAKKLGVTIAGCYSTNAEKAASFGRDFGCTVFSNPLDLIDRKKIDLLYLVVPPFAHDGTVELAAVKQKIPMLVEKPIGLDLNLCRRIARAVEKARLVVSVGYMLREMPLLDEARAVLARNRITSLRACRMSGFPTVHWWRKMATSGGPMVEQTTHLVDLLRFVFGDVAKVAAFTSYGIGKARFEGCDVFDSMEAIMSFQSGAIGNIGLTDTFNNGFNRHDLFDVFGQDFSLTFDANHLRYQEGKSEWVERPAPRDFDLVLEVNKHFIAAAESNNPSAVKSTYSDAVKTLEATLAMNKSAETGKVISLGKPAAVASGAH